jgi:hypothetical protein
LAAKAAMVDLVDLAATVDSEDLAAKAAMVDLVDLED